MYCTVRATEEDTEVGREESGRKEDGATVRSRRINRKF